MAIIQSKKIQAENDAIENPPADRNKTELTLTVTEPPAISYAIMREELKNGKEIKN